MKTFENLNEITELSKEEQSKIMGGMRWNGFGSDNVEDNRSGHEFNNTLFTWINRDGSHK
ncbi:hypothetical protein [Pedobacter mendelii]|uniref:Bacteriocin-type signal sequence n=1 Tax=Pedobacter mendelii TaxID=1908240 RepID=A0ABQ2BJR5_9SPHI|nr:hypothetical protein [Pedobacter mendelii]GGI26745.1 hypothetical protein GCM10008119_24200 [Pedobacter mendelii]